MYPFILKKEEAGTWAIWETHCQHSDVSILLHHLLNQRKMNLCWVGEWESESMGRRMLNVFLEGESHYSCAFTREKSWHSFVTVTICSGAHLSITVEFSLPLKCGSPGKQHYILSVKTNEKAETSPRVCQCKPSARNHSTLQPSRGLT